MPEANLTERQAKWFASVRAGLERDTGRTLAEWVAIARSCPETAHRARLKWLKDHHGLLQNRASQVLGEAFGSASAWSQPEALVEALWIDPASRAIFSAVSATALDLPEVVQTARKGYSAWSRKAQFAALRPLRGGKAMLGLAIAPGGGANLEAPRSEPWSERLTACLRIADPADVNADVRALLRAAWERA